MKHIIIAILFLTQSLFSIAQEKKILFVGNSLTSYNDMPKTIQKMIDEKKITIKIDQITPGGYSLVAHAKFKNLPNGDCVRVPNGETAPTVEKILSEKWDMVVLQEATTSILIPEDLKYYTLPAMKYLDSVIKIKHSKTLLYQNFTHQMFPVTYSTHTGADSFIFKLLSFDPNQNMDIPTDSIFSPHFQNSTQEFETLEKEYNNIAMLIHADIADVGYYFELCKKKYPTIPLYFSMDDYHPSKEGSYLIACVFFKNITKEKLRDIKFYGDIDKKTAKILRNLVDEDPN